MGDIWENLSRLAKAERARWYRYYCEQLLALLVYRALCCKESQIMIGHYDLRLTNFITNFAQLSYISSQPGQADITKTTASYN